MKIPLLIAALGGPKKGKVKEPPMDDHAEALEAVAQDMLDAIKAGDAKGLAEALRASSDVCSGYSEEE